MITAIDLSSYNLTYHRISDDKVFLGKRITRLDRKLIDPETGETQTMSHYLLKKSYRPDKANQQTKAKRLIANSFHSKGV